MRGVTTFYSIMLYGEFLESFIYRKLLSIRNGNQILLPVFKIHQKIVDFILYYRCIGIFLATVPPGGGWEC